MKELELLKEILARKISAPEGKIKETFDFIKMIPLIDDDMSKLQPFVFKSKNDELRDVPKSEDDILSTPFELFSIELEDIALTCSEFDTPDGYGVNIQALICKELSPKEYIFWMYNKITLPTGKFVYKVTKIEKNTITSNNKEKYTNEDMYNSCFDIVSLYMKRLHNEYTGIFDDVGRAKIKYKGKKGFYKPKGVVYVSPKKNKSIIEKKVHGKTIDWDHVWTVIAHWRRLKNPLSLGLNRLGERTEKGHTFIKSYSKGEGKDLTKIRRVKW